MGGGKVSCEVSAPPADGPEFAHWQRRTLRPEDFESLPDEDVDALRRSAVREEHARVRSCSAAVSGRRRSTWSSRGELELVYETEFERLIVQVIGDRSRIGDLPVMLETPYAYSAIVRRPTTTRRLGLDTVRTLIQIYPHICFRWLRLVAPRLERAHRRLVEIAGRSAFEQVVHFLIHEPEERRDPTVELTQSELAETLGVGRQTVSRVLRQLAPAGPGQDQAGSNRCARPAAADQPRARMKLDAITAETRSRAGDS